MEENRENHIYSNIEDAFLKLQKGQVVMHAIDAMAKAAHKSDPHSTPNVKIFGSSKSSYYNLIFTEKSPLLPMFKKAAIITFETGKYDIISKRWQGGEIKSTDEMDMALGMSDFMNFVFLVFVFFICSTCLLLEIFCFHTFNKTFICKVNFQKGKLQIKHKIRRHST